MKTCENCGISQEYKWFRDSGIRNVCDECWTLEFKNNPEALRSYIGDYPVDELDVNEYR